MSSSAVFILDLKGKTIISRNYRGDVDMGLIDRFLPLLMDREEEGLASPVISNQDVTFVFIKHNNIYLVSTCRSNVNVTLVLSFLFKCVEVFTEYFKDVEEESIRDNFVVIYELLDEMMDFGFPQTTESRILQEFITQEGHKLENAPRPPMAVTNAVSWRSDGIKYRKNEVFLDVIESVNMLANANGTVLQSEIVGCVKMRVYLTGMPELRLGLNDKVLFEGSGRGKSKSVELEDVKFHQCVRLSRFDNDRTISFIPPDGAFELMSYRLTTVVKPLIWIETNIERHSHSRVEFMIKAKSQFKRRSTANNVEIIIPVPSDADSPKFKTSIGSVRYAPEQSAFVWTIKSFPGGKEYLLSAHFSLPSVIGEEAEGRPPIKVKFEIPYFTTSGIQMRHYTAYAEKFFRRHVCSSKPTSSTPLMTISSLIRVKRFATQRSLHLSALAYKEESELGNEYASKDLIPGPHMLRRIVADLNKSGRQFILPTADPDSMEQLAYSLRSLVNIGVKPEFLIDACRKNPDLFRNLTTKGEESYQILKILVNSCGMTYEDSLRMFSSYGDDLLACSSDSVQARVDVLVTCDLESGRACGRVVRKCPAILFARDPLEMRKLVEALGGFFSRREITAIVQTAPEVLLKNIEELEEKYEYIFFHMCIEGDEFKECTNWAVMNLEDIMMRHEFLMKTGRYTTPDPKHPQKKMENPRLHQILDSSDDHFAVQVAGVTSEEWAVYRAFSELMSSRGDKERPYERVKPSMRKAFERRRKEEKVIGDHTFDVAFSHQT
ncbi:hypothetical protein KIN20_000639 [Parelaphostrongylus tenuis]|uniref:MHD domain-containing protein n=1 Tax=Parelaphostrongylus tenuis TaxID=148309 RepID=A0AAD5QE11_PARTN|nr:hypothetical protein KIN20_000639 [Parelaphostrongylus tenuis]